MKKKKKKKEGIAPMKKILNILVKNLNIAAVATFDFPFFIENQGHWAMNRTPPFSHHLYTLQI